MAIEKLSEGIRKFTADLIKLRRIHEKFKGLLIDFSDFRRKFNEDEITITKKDLPKAVDLCQHWLKEVKGLSF